MTQTRRTFVQQAAFATWGLLKLAPNRWSLAARDIIPEPDEGLLRNLALRAVDAARAAGATFADVRVAMGDLLAVSSGFIRGRSRGAEMGIPTLRLRLGYGVRAVVDGTWGFAAGNDMTPEGIVEAARHAVERARSNRPRARRTLELAPTPRVVDGRWAIPIEQDPFAVEVREQVDVQFAALDAVLAMPGVNSASVDFSWHRATRVFASSEGSLIVQRTAFAFPGGVVGAQAGEAYPITPASVEGFERGPFGYEAVSTVDVRAELREAAERAIAESKRAPARPTPVEPGRYDIVVSAGALGGFLAATLADALNAERALGYRANREGTSFADPRAGPSGALRVGSPLLTIRADRTRRHGTATVGWDDEGVPAQSYTLVREGVLADYLTNRETAAQLKGWYARQEPVGSHGCASGTGTRRPIVVPPNLTVEPSRGSTTLDDLIRGTKRGLYIVGAWGGSDQQVLNSQFGAQPVREIRNGKLAGPLDHVGLQFTTPLFWKSLDAIGGPQTSTTTLSRTGLDEGDPLELAYASMSAVPGRFRQVNVLNTGRTA